MANIFLKHLCFSPFKCFPTSLPPPSHTLVSENPNFMSSDTSGDFSDDFSDDFESLPPNLASVFASDRFFFSSPGQSNSILDLPENPTPVVVAGARMDGGVAVQTDSPDPYSDFRRSMQEMVEAREYTDMEGDWDFLHELLLCYLMLNPKHTHKFIVGAFSDLLITLMASSSASRRKIDTHPRVDNYSDSVCCSSSGSESVFSQR